MSEENKTPETERPETDEALNAELDQLKDLFQAELDKAAAEAANEGQPVIQELDYSAPADVDDEDDHTSEDGEDAARQDDVPVKQKKAHRKLPFVLLTVFLVLLLIVLGSYVALSIKIPTFGSYVSSYANAVIAKDKEDELDYYKKALDSCAEGTLLEKQRQALYEKITFLLYETEGYDSAKAYEKEHITDEMRAKPKTAEYKEFLKLYDLLNRISDELFDTAAAAYETAGNADGIDYTALAKQMGTPEPMEDDVIAALRRVADGLEIEKNAASAEERSDAVNEYLAAENLLFGLNVETQKLLEQITVHMFNAGCAYEAALMRDQLFDDEMLADVKTEGFTAMLEKLAALKDIKTDLTAAAQKAAAKTGFTDGDVLSALTAALPAGTDAAPLVQAASALARGLQAMNENDLSTAITDMNRALNIENALGLNTNGTAENLIICMMRSGDARPVYTADGETLDAYGMKQKYITNVYLKLAGEEFKAAAADLDAIHKAFETVEAAFLTVSNQMDETEEPDKAAFTEALDALEFSEDDVFGHAYLSYFRYVVESVTDKDEPTMEKYLRGFAEPFEKYPAYYAAELATMLLYKGSTDEAAELADLLMENDTSDMQAIYLKQITERSKGNTEEAIALAQRGLDASGVSAFREELVKCRLAENDIAGAFADAKELFEANAEQLSRDMCEYLLICEALYQGDDADLRADMEEYKAQVENIYETYGITVGETAQDVIDGKKTAAEVFCKPPFALRDPNA